MTFKGKMSQFCYSRWSNVLGKHVIQLIIAEKRVFCSNSLVRSPIYGEIKMAAKWIVFVVLICAIEGACSSGPKEKRLKIGFAMDTLKEERWQRDHDAFDAHCKQMNVDCVI